MKCSVFCPFWSTDVQLINLEVYYIVRCAKRGLVVERQTSRSQKRGECVVAADELRAHLMAMQEELETKLLDVKSILSKIDQTTPDVASKHVAAA